MFQGGNCLFFIIKLSDVAEPAATLSVGVPQCRKTSRVPQKAELCDVDQNQHFNGWVRSIRLIRTYLGGDNDAHARMRKRFVWCTRDALG